MRKVFTSMSTGLSGLDDVLQGVLPGDNIVFQVDRIEDYVPFVHPFCIKAAKEGSRLIYFRFADHPPLLPPNVKADVHTLHPEDGFENFLSEIMDVIEEAGTGACYVFDCLSELAVDWYSDRMLANFFMLTCPYLYDFETATYFALLRNYHSPLAVNAIHSTAQVIIDVYHDDSTIYLQPLKVYKRYSPTLYMLHARKGDSFTPVTRSDTIAEILSAHPQTWLDFSTQRLDVWSRAFAAAQQCLDDLAHGREPRDNPDQLFARLLRMAFTRDPRIIERAGLYLDLADLVNIGKRMIGTGLIGGKSVGMLLARAMLKKADPYWRGRLERHDSFFIGSDIFYSYLIQNGCWWIRRRLTKSRALLDGYEEVRQRMRLGSFPAEIRDQFVQMLDYFGQSPIIVRSSSLLEDAYGNSFSGKYESVFCANQGTPQERLDEFTSAVRVVYASTMKRDALAYRAHWGLMDSDEQMALLVQRVSGAKYNDLFFPQVAGVGFSFNPYVWSSEIDPHEGMLRLVFGLGTRAVDRSDDDYTHVVALNAPTRRPESTFDEVRKYAQRKVDVIDCAAKQHVSRDFDDVAAVAENAGLPVAIFASRDEEAERRARETGRGRAAPAPVLTFDSLLTATDFVADMRRLLKTLHDGYEHAVDIEFTANFTDEKNYRINLVQCRPFQVKSEIRSVKMPQDVPQNDTMVRTTGPIIGNSASLRVDRLIYIRPSLYSGLPMQDRYTLARLIGRLTHGIESENPTIVLVGPGRWGTTTPSLGVPVSFSEINTVSVLCEIARMHEGLVPDVSLGTHFFNDLVEMDMLYLAVYPDRPGHTINETLLSQWPNRLTALLPDAATWEPGVLVIEQAGDRQILLNVDSQKQEGVIYRT